LYSSPVLLAELLDVVSRQKFAGRFGQAGLTPLGIVSEIRRLAVVVVPADVPHVVERDTDDDHVLACALAARADLIVSGDKHLHALGGSYEGIPIVRPADAVALIAGNGG
jgi:putative PIN family toxin of toxin-antitoxin system